MENEKKPEIKVTAEVLEMLTKMKESLPWGAQTEIAEKTEYTKEYVRQFFKGYHELTDDNMKIMEYAKKMSIADKKKSVELSNKAVQIAAEFIAQNKKLDTNQF